MDNLDFSGENWFSLHWFQPEVLSAFDWAHKMLLLLIFLIPIAFLVKWFVSKSLGQKMPVALPDKQLKWSPVVLLRFIPGIFMLLALACVVIALGRPQKTNEKVEQWTEGIDIMMVIDISESMQIEDFKPNRLEAAKEVAENFVAGRFQDRIGIVVFSGDAYSLSPLTTDYDLLKAHLSDIDFDMIQNRGTAIGSALAVATNRMRESEAASKVVILLSDGENTAGNIDPITAAELADAYNIKIYTIAVGKEGRVPFGKDFFGQPKYIENSLDETTLRKIADIGNGHFYRVSNNKALEEVFGLIDTYEKAEIKENRYKDTSDFYQIYLKWAIGFFLIWFLFKSTFVSNVLQD
ncbi:MAG: VWA domain-containing protein [Cyclobacteriaceae bacterium]|nr:VWA domain-containing protein [Cyclobacteriaceae bacterium]